MLVDRRITRSTKSANLSVMVFNIHLFHLATVYALFLLQPHWCIAFLSDYFSIIVRLYIVIVNTIAAEPCKLTFNKR